MKSRARARKSLGITWSHALTLCAHDIGISGSSVKKGQLARLVCERMGWAFTTADEIIIRRSAELLGLGAPKRAKKKSFVYIPKGTGRKLGPPHPDYVRCDGFYKSREWREVRYFALINAGGGCQCCGAKSSDGSVLHVDHIVPRYRAPHLSLSLDNLQVLCEDCNLGKGAWDETDWRVKMEAV